MSYALPGRDKQVYVGKSRIVKILLPKKYLTWTFNELHEFLKKGTDEELSCIKFSMMLQEIPQVVSIQCMKIMKFMPIKLVKFLIAMKI